MNSINITLVSLLYISNNNSLTSFELFSIVKTGLKFKNTKKFCCAYLINLVVGSVMVYLFPFM